MVQASPAGDISLCDGKTYFRSSSSTSSNLIGYIYTTDFKKDDELEQKTKKYPFFRETTKANFDQFTDYQNEKKRKKSKPNEKLTLKFTDKKRVCD